MLSIFTSNDLNQFYETFLGRIPIFVLGIICYKSKFFFIIGSKLFLAILIPALILYCYHLIHTYVLMYCLGPLVILLISCVIPAILSHGRLTNIFKLLGDYSLEIYIANTIICIVVGPLFTGWVMSLVYWSLHVLITPILYLANNFAYKTLT